MKKIEAIEARLLEARKSKDTVTKNALLTFKGEYETLVKSGHEGGNNLVHTIAKKMIKSATELGTVVALKEIEILSVYLPQMASRDEVIEFLKDKDLTLGGRLIGMAKSHFNGNVEPKLINEVINDLKRN